MALTDIKCKALQSTQKSYKVSDEKGLYLEVAPSGGKYWRLKYRFGGKEKKLAFGVYPEVSLKEARDKRDIARKQIKDNIDPSQEKKLAKLNQKNNSYGIFNKIKKNYLLKSYTLLI